ncbi:DUF805 domain-containing protein [Aliidiomarina minuta]|uniref:DUF805 domain-containing protein n=1 Tax=Aliidiomarina minuta TaxID=880057 RepID=A0A432W1B3_9GAMM|nr:DUF805 domain-containing protein [Aliidiomarina minuta]RUO23005.1 DUF805 domain-containing protein [Aliidiomarina minuta]
MKWFLKVVQNYAVFQGRARRKEYWMFALFYAIFYVLAIVLDGVLGTLHAETGIGLITTIYLLALLIPSLAVLVRRLHDTNRSGWMALLMLIPLIGSIIIFIFMLLDGTQGENDYGSDPKLASE